MPRDSNGNTQPLPGTIVSSGETIQPSQHNPMVVDLYAMMTQSLSRDGQGGMRASLNMNGFRISNVGAPELPTDAVSVDGVGAAIGQAVSTAPNKSTPVDGDGVMLSDSAAGGILKRLTWANLKTAIGIADKLDKTGGVVSGRLVAGGGHGNNPIGTATAGLGNIAINSSATGAAAMALFNGPFAGYFGLDIDNKLKWGGWSMGANAYEIYHQGNVPTVTLAEAQAGTGTAIRMWTPERVAQAAQANGGLGVGQTWKAVSRTEGVSYQNTTGKTISASASISATSGETSILWTMEVSTNGSSWVIVDSKIITIATPNTLSGIVPNNNYYRYRRSATQTHTLSARELN